MIILKDGVKYTEWKPSNERNEFEPMVKDHIKDIFGENIIYFDIKKKIETAVGLKTIPDGYLINLDKKEFYILEFELSIHPEYSHINKQISKFISALKNYQTRQKLAKILKDYILEDIVKERTLTKQIDDKEGIYEFFLNVLEKVIEQRYSIIIIIDEKTDKIVDACDMLHPKPNIGEFKTYARTSVDPTKVHIHLFEPFYTYEPGPIFTTQKEPDKKDKKQEESKIEDIKVSLNLPTKKGVKRIDWQGKDGWLYDKIREIYIRTLEDILIGNARGLYPTLEKRIKNETEIELTRGTIAGLLYAGAHYDKEGIHLIGWWKKNGGLEAFLKAKKDWGKKGWIS